MQGLFLVELTSSKPYKALMLLGFNLTAWEKYAFAVTMLS